MIDGGEETELHRLSSGGRAIVVGAGIAGILAAQMLVRHGFRVRLLEREPSLRTDGAGLSLWPNALNALRGLGCGAALDECAHTVPEGVTLKPDGRLIARAPLDLVARRHGPLLSVHRGELLEAMVKWAGVPVEYGAAVTCAEDGLRLNDELLAADLVIGADGIGSVVREAVAPDVSPRPAGYGAWRGIASTAAATPRCASETLGRGRRFGLVPLGKERTYWFAALRDADEGVELEEAFEEWHEPIAAVLAATPASNRFYLGLADLPPLPRWHCPGIALVGDAAHAMTPNLGQGAAQAILDVSTLDEELSERPLTEALPNYERRRKRVAERIVRQSRLAGRIAQLSSPVGIRLRDGIAAGTPRTLLAWQMGRVLRA